MNDWSPALSIVIIVLTPALALMSALGVFPRLNVIETFAVAFGLGLSLFPLLYLWASTLAFRLAAPELYVLIALSVALAVTGVVVRRGQLRDIFRRAPPGQLLVFAVLFFLIVYVRFA